MTGRVVAAMLVAVVLAGCGGSSGSQPAPAQTPTSRPGLLTAAHYGKAWPLKVRSAVVKCHQFDGQPLGQMVTVTIRGREYAVNGTARGAGYWPDFNRSGYWRNDRTLGHGLKVSIDPIITAGLRLCP